MLSPGGPEKDSPGRENSGTPGIQLKTRGSHRRKDALVSDLFVFLILAFAFFKRYFLSFLRCTLSTEQEESCPSQAGTDG